MSLPLIVSYKAAHRRTESARGFPSEYLCVMCFKPAEQWAYDHRCSDELMWKGLRYSPHPGHYMPMCCKCHHNYDANVRAARAIIESLPPAM